MSNTVEEHKYWCPDFPNCCTSEDDIQHCKGESLRKYMEYVDQNANSDRGDSDSDSDSRSDNDTHSDDQNRELDDYEFSKYVNSIIEQSDDVSSKSGGCGQNQCGGFSNKLSSKWVIPK